MLENDKPAATPATETKALAVFSPDSVPGGLQLYLNPDMMNQLYKVADMYAQSDIIPKAFAGKKGNCFIALEMAGNMGISPVFLMQNMAVVHGKPTLEAKLISAMVNASGRFVDPLDYEIKGGDPSYDKAKKLPKDPDYKVRAYATRKRDNKVLYGPWITWEMAIEEKWVDKDGSKWKTMPELMFMYRAASYFAKIHCTDITYGMQSTEEMMDVIDITPESTPSVSRVEKKKQRAGKILSAFEEEGGTTEGAEQGETIHEANTYDLHPDECDHHLDDMQDTVPGEAVCTKCGTSFTLDEGAPTIKEQQTIRAQELAESSKEQQEKLFK